MEQLIQLLTTVNDKATAQSIARTLVQKQLAACVQIDGPIESCYRWKGNIQVSEEWRCTIKSRQDRLPALQQELKDLHPYELPEVLCLAVIGASKPYYDWVSECVQPKTA
ncbi:MAG: divalent-cation tolerance protein CutA [Planctomycetota bacterium]